MSSIGAGDDDGRRRLRVDLADGFWAPRVAQLHGKTLSAIWERMEEQGVLDNFRRIADSAPVERRAMHFSDSDLYKWVEAAALAGGADHLAEAVDLIVRVQDPDGYVGTYYGRPGFADRYSDLDFGHEQYCIGHLLEAAISHHAATGSEELLEVARRAADHLLGTFGPGRDEHIDAHPEIELALCRLAAPTGEARYVDHAAWVIERQLDDAGLSLETYRLGGHAVRAIYLTSGIAEVALATGDRRWARAACRVYAGLVDHHSYPTGAVGGRWLGESVGRRYELPDASAYAESCAAVAAAQLSWRMWRLDHDPRALDHLELLVFNAVPCGVGADGESWFYSQPQAVDDVEGEVNPWRYEFDYGQMMLREWFPVHRHRWFDVPCCPGNLARMFASVPRLVAEQAGGDLLIHLPLAGHITGGGWDVTVVGDYPFDAQVHVEVHRAPPGGHLRVRRPGWASGDGHDELPRDGIVTYPSEPTWWTTDQRVEGAPTVHIRRGPVVCCVEGADHPGVDLRGIAVDPSRSPASGFVRLPGSAELHRRWTDDDEAIDHTPVAPTLVPYADWGNRGITTMRTRFPVVLPR